MTQPGAARAFLEPEVDGLEPFGFLVVCPSGRPLHGVEVTRGEDHALTVCVPGRPTLLPELAAGARSALRERGFASEDPADGRRPWARSVEDAGEAVTWVQRVLVEVFGEKPDADLDLAHGSHRAEHEMEQKLAEVRTRLERVLSEVADGRPEQDADGDYVLPLHDVHVVVAPRAVPGGVVVVRIFAICNVGVNVVPELGLFLARLNFGLMFGRFALDSEHRSIWFDETLLGDHFVDEELRFAIDVVARTADEWDDRLKQMFGGATYQEVVTGRTRHEVPPTKPGQGGYL